jgi:hypothetical protein
MAMSVYSVVLRYQGPNDAGLSETREVSFAPRGGRLVNTETVQWTATGTGRFQITGLEATSADGLVLAGPVEGGGTVQMYGGDTFRLPPGDFWLGEGTKRDPLDVARSAYIAGEIDLDEFERCVEESLIA